MMRSAFGTLGIVALFVAVGLGLLATFGAFGKKPTEAFSGQTPTGSQPSGTEGTTAEQVDQFKRTAATIGETVTAGDLTWTVTDAHQVDEITRQTPPQSTRPGNYVTLDFTVKNASEKPVTLDSKALTLFSEDGRKFQPQSQINDSYIDPEKDVIYTENSLFQPGETKEGVANFELPLNTSPSVLQLGDNDPTVKDEKYVDLEGL